MSTKNILWSFIVLVTLTLFTSGISRAQTISTMFNSKKSSPFVEHVLDATSKLSMRKSLYEMMEAAKTNEDFMKREILNRWYAVMELKPDQKDLEQFQKECNGRNAEGLIVWFMEKYPVNKAEYSVLCLIDYNDPFQIKLCEVKRQHNKENHALWRNAVAKFSDPNATLDATTEASLLMSLAKLEAQTKSWRQCYTFSMIKMVYILEIKKKSESRNKYNTLLAFIKLHFQGKTLDQFLETQFQIMGSKGIGLEERTGKEYDNMSEQEKAVFKKATYSWLFDMIVQDVMIEHRKIAARQDKEYNEVIKEKEEVRQPKKESGQ